MTPYQFGIKMAVKTAASPQAMNMNVQPKPLTSGQRVENYMRNINQPDMRNIVAPPKPQTPVLPNLNTSMLMGNNQPQYSPSPEYNQSSNFMGSAPVADIDVGPLDVPSQAAPSALASMPSTKQLMSKVPVAVNSPFGQNVARTAPAPVPQPAPTDVAKF